MILCKYLSVLILAQLAERSAVIEPNYRKVTSSNLVDEIFFFLFFFKQF
jgi:hypothetical protein